MATSTSIETVADLLEQLGPISLSRIRPIPAPGVATEQDVVDLDTHEDRLYELIDGVLVEKVMGFYKSYLAVLIGRFLGNFASDNDLGIVAGSDGMLKLFPGQVRIPDVCFVSWDRLPNREVPRDPVPDLVPDLAVEVISKGNTQQEMNRKLHEYFEAGVQLVWYVYPKTETVHIYASVDNVLELSIGQSLDGGEVLPGFELQLDKIFSKPRTETEEASS